MANPAMPTPKADGPQIKSALKNSVLLAGAAMASAYPMFYYHYQHLPEIMLGYRLPVAVLDRFVIRQTLLVFLLGFVCALVGFLYSKRLRLPAFGTSRDGVFWLTTGLILGLLCTPLIYHCCDRPLYRWLPILYPAPWYWALAEMLGSALTQELLARFGLLTIGVYFLDRWGWRNQPWLVIVPIAIFATFGAYQFLDRFGLPEARPGALVPPLILTFCLQWLLCTVYLRWGFIAALGLHIGLNVKFLFYAVWL